MNARFRRIILSFFALLFVLQVPLAALMLPREARAIPVGVVASVPDAIRIAVDKIKEVIEKGLTVGITQTLNRALITFTANIAQKAALGLAEGGTGGKPLFKTADLKDAVRDSADAAAGDFIDQMGRGLLGQSLCTPPDLRLSLSLSLLGEIAPPKPACTFSDMQKSWGTLNAKGALFNQPDFTKQASIALNPQDSELGQLIQQQIDFKKETAAAAEREASTYAPNEFERVINPVSKTTKTPAGIVETQANTSLVGAQANVSTKIFEPTGDWRSDWAKVGAGVFITTFTNRYFQRLLTGLFNVQPKQRNISLPGGGAATAGGNFTASSDVSSVSLNTTGGEYDVLNDFTSCPDDPAARSIYNCVVDQGLAEAIRSEMSVNDAMYPDPGKRQQPLLRPDWAFGFSGVNADQEPTYTLGYSYSNMKKMRRMRILPVGWELAAEVVRDLPKPNTTLADVVAGFDIPTSPFYRLVDPQWILKSPQLQCRLKAPSQLLSPGTDTRQELCVDVQDCVATTDDGSGCKSWGYCTRERNAWQFPGRSCAPQFNTCQSFTRTRDGKSLSYIKNTLTQCNPEAAGCLRYDTTQNQSGTLWTSATPRFLNQNAESCSPENVGCSQFLTVSAIEQGRVVDKTKERYTEVQGAANKQADPNKKTASDYYASNGLTVNTLHLSGKRIECKGGAGENETANVGCELYTPATDDAAVPAVVTRALRTADGTVTDWKNECPSACVGYDAYKEVATSFQDARFPVYFVPKNARACSADAVGCDEFTNLDQAGRRGEAREYFTSLRQCQKPATDSRTYFTWVGTETTGFQLQTHVLKASNLDAGRAPCTNRRLSDNTCVDASAPENRAICTKADLATNPDCREFYDEQGVISYRLYSRTIISDEACVRYRKSTSDATSCVASGGAWNGTAQECTYLAFPKENRSCSAAAVGCREYKGNTANDVRMILNETFEPKDGVAAALPSAWDTGVISTVSLSASGHSVAAQDLGSSRWRVGVKLGTAVKERRTYILSFYARSTAQGSLLPTFRGGAGADNQFARNKLTQGQDLVTSPTWQLYTLGPVFVTWAPNDTEGLEFNSTSGQFFLDNVILKEVRDDFYFLQNSLAAPAACETPTVGAMAGCRAYTDRASVTTNARSFERLCKLDYVGCQAMIDTKNSVLPYQEKFKDTVGTVNDDVPVSADSIQYFVDNPATYCAESQKGCSAVAVAATTASFAVRTCKSPSAATNGKPCDASVAGGVSAQACTDTKGVCQDTTTKYLRNDPDAYGKILCTETDVGCDSYAMLGGGSITFRDPGTNTCEWRRLPGTTDFRYGWFKTTTSTDATTPDCSSLPAEYPPPLDGSDTPRFDPNDPTRIVGLNDQQYPRYVRSCPAIAQSCTAFVDPQDTSSSFYPTGRPYFAINDDTLRAARGACNGVARQKEGCVLFRNQSNIKGDGTVELTYSSSKTLENNLTEHKAVTPVPCADDPTRCDTNELLKVKRDRTCGEWLTCVSGAQVSDSVTRSLRDVCYQVGACTEASPTNAGLCAQFAPQERDPKVFTKAVYTARGTGPGGSIAWQDPEYSGYSIPYRYPVSSLRPLAFSTNAATGAPDDFQLAAWGVLKNQDGTIKRCTLATAAQDCEGTTARCVFTGTSTASLQQGICYGQHGIGINPNDGKQQSGLAKSCRAFAKADAPFPWDVTQQWHQDPLSTVVNESPGAKKRPAAKRVNFEQANVAQYPLDQANSGVSVNRNTAQCSYQRVEYQDGTTLFFDLGYANIQSLKYYDGLDPDPDTYPLRRLSTEYGLNGYCLEEDKRTPLNGDDAKDPKARFACFTWFPVDLVQGEVDVNNIELKAGYSVDPTRRFYCAETRDEEYHTTFGYTPACGLDSTRANAATGYSCTSKRGNKCGRATEGKNHFHYTCNPIGGAGWYPVGEKAASEADETRRVCTKIALVTEPLSNQNLAWTDRLAGREAMSYEVPDLRYIKSTASDPYGATNAGALDFTTSQLYAICDGGTQHGKSCVETSARRLCLENGGTCGPLVVRPAAPNAGSPYARVGELAASATERLKNIFARGFGLWEWQGNVTSCVKYCSGGMYRGSTTQCTTDAQCPADATARCVDDPTEAGRKICSAGSQNEGLDCTDNDTVCSGAGQCTFLGGQCEVGSAAYNPVAATLAPNFAWDFSGTANTQAKGPVVHAAVYNSTTRTYTEGGDGVTLDNASDGDLRYTGDRPVTLKFYAYNENGNQMPLRRIMVDWGDGSEPTANIGSFKNHKKECRRYCYNTTTNAQVTQGGQPIVCETNLTCGRSPDGTSRECRVATFGDSTDACVQDAAQGTPGYFIFTHVYRCDPGPQNPTWDSTAKACVFKPKVQVLDNWGWCNGNCADTGGRGCYDNVKGKDLVCSDTKSAQHGSAWSSFKGRLLLTPLSLTP